MSRPVVIGIPCDHRIVGPHPFHMEGGYIAAIREGVGALPLLIPVLDTPHRAGRINRRRRLWRR